MSGPGDDDKDFLAADDDLLGELDAWDRTFDALHEEESASARAAAAAEAADAADGHLTPVPAGEPSEAPATATASPSPSSGPRPSFPTPVPGPGFQSPFKDPAASAVARPGASAFDSPFEAGTTGGETDFSDLGVAGTPQALGALLGVPPPLQPVDEAGGTIPPPSGPAGHPRRPSFPPMRAPSSPGFEDEDEDSVFTSASRPIVRVSQPRAAPGSGTPLKLHGSPTDEELFGDLPADVPSGTFPKVAPPPPAAAQSDMTRVADANMALFDDGFGDHAAQRTRIADPNQQLLAETRSVPERASRSPAIVRRSERRIETPRPEAHDDFAGPEATRVADLADIERMAAQQREEASAAAAAFFAADQAPEVVLEADEDFYDDIEIGGATIDEVDDRGTPSAVGRRTTAHVVRRSGGGAASDGQVIELEADDHDDSMSRRPSLSGPVLTSAAVVATRSTAGAPARGSLEDDIAMSVDEALADVEMVTPAPGARPSLRAPTVPPAEEDFSDVAPAEDDFSDVAAAVASRTVPVNIADLEGSGRAFTADVAAAAAMAVGRADAADLGDFDDLRTPVPPGEPLPSASTIDAMAAEIDAVESEPPDAVHAIADGVPAATGETMSGAIAAATAMPGLAHAVAAALAPAPPPPAKPATTRPPIAESAVPVPAPRERSGPELAPELPPPRLIEPDLALDLDAIALPERVDPTAGMDLTEAAAQSLLVLERELESLDDGPATAGFRIEAGRLGERVGDVERARLHYEAALLSDPRATSALRGLRRIARSIGDVGEVTSHLDAELALAGPLERRALTLHRIDLLMASGEQDLARVAVGELLDETGADTSADHRGDVRALLAHLELAFLDGRADEFGEALGHLAAALVDPALRAAVETARGHLEERSGGDRGRAASAFTAAAAADPGSRVARIGGSRLALVSGDRAGHVASLLALAAQVAATDADAAAGLGLRGAEHARRTGDRELEATAVAGAAVLAAADPLLVAAQASLAGRSGDTASAAAAFRALAESAVDPAERAHAALRAAATADADTARNLLSLAVSLDGDDEVAAAALVAQLAPPASSPSGEPAAPNGDPTPADPAAAAPPTPDASALIAFLTARLAADPSRLRDRIQLARVVATARGAGPDDGHAGVDRGLALLSEGRTLAPANPALIDAEAAILASAGRRAERARLLTEVARAGGDAIDAEVAHLRAAVAVEAAAGDDGEPSRNLVDALDAWTRVLDLDPDSGRGHGAAIAVARRLADRDVLIDVLGRAQAQARTPAAAVSFALARARAAADGSGGDRGRAEDILREVAEVAPDDPRRATAALILAAGGGRLADAAAVLEEQAAALGSDQVALAAQLRFRAAHLLLDRGDDPNRAVQLLRQVAIAVPGFPAATDLLSTARRRTGDTAPGLPQLKPVDSGTDAFSRLVREADQLALQGEAGPATQLYARALQLRPGDPLAAEPLARAALAAHDSSAIAELALAELKHAEESGDSMARADAYEALARVDGDLRGDAASALLGLESAAEADPRRHAVLRRLERAYVADGRWSELARVRDRQIAALGPDRSASAGDNADAAALLFDRIVIAERDGADGDEVAPLHRTIVELDRRARLALFHLETQVRRQGASAELADLELAIAELFGDDLRSRAAFLTRAGETLTDLGDIDGALARFREAATLRPGHVPALQGWRAAALGGQLWIDLAEAATREAEVTAEPAARAGLHHLAGVAYMDRALVSDRAAAALRRAIDADPGHKDAFLRLRILLAEHGDYEDLATVLDGRLGVETEPAARIELHRALADLHRNFLGDRDTAKRHYRAILDDAAGDRPAVAALADICWEQGAWPECADALMVRARLERDPDVQKGIYTRLGSIYADRLPDPQHAIKAFQRVLALDPNDHFALERLADLGMVTGEWKMALGACERLVKAEPDPEKRVGHLHRVGRIFQAGFHDRKRAERAYTMALDLAPTHPAALHELVRFYLEGGDPTSIRIHTGRVAAAMRARLQTAPLDGVAYRAVARAMAARASAQVPGSLEVARAAAEMSILTRGLTLGDATGETPEDSLLHAATPPIDLARLTRPEADDLLFPRSVPAEIRQIFALLGDRIAKHVGVDLRPYGVTRGDRLRAREHPVAVIAHEIAERFGLGEVDVYLSQRQPLAMVAEPTSPVSLVLGAQLAEDPAAVRFAAAAALKLAQVHLAIRGGPVDDLGVLVVALLRLFTPDFPYLAVDADAIVVQNQKLRRLIPTSLMNELRPFALAIDPSTFDHRALARGIATGGFRAGILAVGGVSAALRVLMARGQIADIATAMNDTFLRDLVLFAVGDEHASLLAL